MFSTTQFKFEPTDDSLERAIQFDETDPLRGFRGEFHFPVGENSLYFAGHSLGLMPKRAKDFIDEELEAWSRHAVEGHFKSKHPWLPYHENVTVSLARLVGAKESEVVAMNSLTVNLHLMMVSFYRPTAKRFRILIENNTFPSDRYAVDSQARFHGFDPREAVIELKPRAGEMCIREEDLKAQIESWGDSLALVMLGNCNYLSGQYFSIPLVVQAARKVGAVAGFNLAHGAGNLALQLHDWDADFAVWCSYKYLNAGPGGVAGAFVHERHHRDQSLHRFAGWWGHDKSTRFEMGPQFSPIPTVEAWQLSNPPIFQLASLRASLELFDRATMARLREKGDRLTAYFQWLLEKNLGDRVEIVTPPLPERGSMLCLRLKEPDCEAARKWYQRLVHSNAYIDFREPDIIRATPAPLYNSFEDIYRLVHLMKELL